MGQGRRDDIAKESKGSAQEQVALERKQKIEQERAKRGREERARSCSAQQLQDEQRRQASRSQLKFQVTTEANIAAKNLQKEEALG